MKTKIVLITEAMLGGVRKHILDVALNLDKTSFDVYIILSEVRADEAFFHEKDRIISSGIKLICLNEMQREIGLGDYNAYRKLINIIKEIKPDIIHCHSSKAGIIGRLAAKHCKIRRIYYSPHAYAFQDPGLSKLKRIIYVSAEKFTSRYATTMTINVSKGEMEIAKQYRIDKDKKFTFIYNGIPQLVLDEREAILESLGLPTDKIYIGVTARCAEQKDPFTFLEIAGKVIAKKPEVRFLYIGEGHLFEQMKEWITQRGLSDKIYLLGFRKDAARIVAAFEIYLSTALYEGMPYSLIEAIGAGVPIIATDVIGNNEIVIPWVNGMLFEKGNVDDGVKSILQQLEENTIKKDVVLSYKERFSLIRMMERYVEVLA
jgi:glycosyltransferase involved in cell wall biosynthesis